MMKVFIGADIYFRKSEIPTGVLEQVRLHTTFALKEVPGRRQQEEAPKWCAIGVRGAFYTLPRGALGELQKTASQAALKLEYVSEVVYDQTRPMIALESLKIKLRPYQEELVKALVEQRQGYVVLPCGGGKTKSGVAAILHINQAALVLVGSGDLLQQWAATVTEASGRPPRTIGAGKADLSPLKPGEVAVAMVQTLSQHPDAEPFLDSVGAVLTDECHHIAAEQWRWIIDRCPARWRWGLTATPERSDGWGFLLQMLLGKELYRKTTAELVQMGFLQRPTIIPIRSAWEAGASEYRWVVRCEKCQRTTDLGWKKWQEGKTVCSIKIGAKKCGNILAPDCHATRSTLDWAVTSTALAENPDRQALVARLAALAVHSGRQALVLVGRKSVLDPLSSKIAIALPGIFVDAVDSSDSTSEREAKIGRLRAGRSDVLIATTLADEGLDVPALDAVILAQPGKDAGRARQRAGRTTRPEGKPPVVFDIVDPTLSYQWKARKAAFIQEYGPECIASHSPVDERKAAEILMRLEK